MAEDKQKQEQKNKVLEEGIQRHQSMIWQERIDLILSDPKKVKVAGILYYLITSHLKQCDHHRQCPERSLFDEATRVVDKFIVEKKE